jgi:protein MpaA
VTLGRSAGGRPISAVELGDSRAAVSLLLVGCIHGNEPAGIAVAHTLARGAAAGPHMWVVDDLNPDGVAAHTRQNGRGVDLNRNFPFGWRPLPRATGQYSGPRPLSEPEARIAYRLILRVRPAVTIWFHQPLAVVDESGGSLALERRFATLAKLPLRRLTRYPGSAAGWQNHALPGSTGMVVELPSGRPSPGEVVRLATAVRTLALESRRAG